MDTSKVLLTDLRESVNSLITSDMVTTEAKIELSKLQERIEIITQILAKFTDSSEASIYIADFYTGEILMVNEKYSEDFGFPAGELTGKTCWQLAQPGSAGFCAFCPRSQLLDEAGEPGKAHVWENYFADHDVWLRFTSQAIHWVDGRLAHMVSFVDITQTRQIHDQLSQLAFYDRSMQLPNAQKLAADLQEIGLGNGTFLICFDIVSLHEINDAYSRITGDALLRAIADWVLGLNIKSSNFYRIGGDEFSLLVRDCDAKTAETLANKIKNRFTEAWTIRFESDAIQIFCNASLGLIDVSHNPDSYDNLPALMERTLDFSRKNGGIAIYDEMMDLAFKNHVKLELSLKSCVREGMRGFEVYYQPIADPESGMWIALEALCRWNSPEFGPVPPLVFIQEAERQGIIGTLGLWVLDTSVRQCKQWGLDEHEKFLLDVNLSPAQLMDEGFAEKTIEILNKYDYPGDKLSLEITESTEINFSNHTMNAIERLRALDILMSLDDFGTGYSSFNNLKKLPVSLLKTERAFIQGIENDAYLQYLLRVMVELAHAVNMKIIAEGVENKQQMRILLENGVDYLQGFLFGRPVSAGDMESMLGNFYLASAFPEGYRVEVLPAPVGVNEQQLAGKSMTDMFENMEIPVYVTDVHTYELLFANRFAREHFMGASTSRKCYEALWGADHRCDNCPVPLLLSEPKRGKRVWETFDERDKRHYKVHDSLISWPGGKTAHLQYAVDITAIKEYQNKLELVASTDTFTGTLNRSTLIPKLRELLRKAYAYEDILTICFVDINGLKYVNDNFGQEQGDILITKTVLMLKGCMRRDDVLGRYGGDEFVAVLMRCNRETAETKLREANARLRASGERGGVPMSFSFGIVESSEKPFGDSIAYIHGLLEIAEKRMQAARPRLPGRESESLDLAELS